MQEISSLVVLPWFRDDAFADHTSVHRANSAAGSGSHHDERSSSRHEHQSEHTPEHHYGAALGRWDHYYL